MKNEDISARCEALISRGKQFVGNIGYYESIPEYWFRTAMIPELQAWIGSVANFFRMTATPDTYFSQECRRIVESEELRGGVPYHTVQKLLGLLHSIKEEMNYGFLKKIEYIFVSTTFDDFIDHAADYHKAGKIIESAVLVSAVFEDTIRKACSKFEIPHEGESIDSLIDQLGKAGHITPVKAKRYKGHASLRNSALHARWDELDIRDVGSAINGTRELIDDLL